MLFLARSDSAQTRIAGVRLDAPEELEAIREYYEAVADEQGVKLVCEGEAQVSADPVLFKRAVGNLAIQHTPRGGTIILSAQEKGGQDVEVSVRDTGGGIAAEHLPKLFDRFYRVDAARAQQPEGMGLGLAIVKSIMDLHGGDVKIESEPGKGTLVTLRFPAFC